MHSLKTVLPILALFRPSFAAAPASHIECAYQQSTSCNGYEIDYLFCIANCSCSITGAMACPDIGSCSAANVLSLCKSVPRCKCVPN
ncbi:hypothetical protein GQ53DRAFT_341791 [Thozetella sp. PMI_491]|nr:hypothetical protein GQ53DRAFT_341791 [Thozetella sp. PMI_491]